MKMRVEGKPKHKDVSKKKDAIALLTNVKSIAYNFKSQKMLPHALHDLTRSLYKYRQMPGKSLTAFLVQFENLDAVSTACGRSIG